ncbi:hypothetical protein GAR05_00678 [Micromonospora saelicesensis]|uniref:Uncharacterized protein n=1 Tax=Micromonospora saelicesensis TaxID=285676 RepID=A0ABX9CP26_9ACTN|nr:hypothetical protein [Micromonospora saelicesensis]RAO03698.1 hypothetical protein GAR05_00678 [Micromonospora saelicesensis]
MPRKPTVGRSRRFGELLFDAIAGYWVDEPSPVQDDSPGTRGRFCRVLVQTLAGDWAAGGSDDLYSGLSTGPAPPESAPLDDLYAWLKRHPPKDLLDLRTHADDPARNQVRGCGCIEIRRRILVNINQRVADLEAAVHESLANAEFPPEVQAIDILATYLEAAQAPKRPFSHDLAIIRRLANDALLGSGNDHLSDSQRQVLAGIIADLAGLDDVLNDFSGEDLRGIDLTGYRLAGIRWNGETKWPESLRLIISGNSNRISPESFIIRDDFPLNWRSSHS